MKDYRPDGCKMYVAAKDIIFPPVDFGGEELKVSKGDVWMLQQLTFGDRVWLKKHNEDESFLQIFKDQLESDFIVVRSPKASKCRKTLLGSTRL